MNISIRKPDGTDIEEMHNFFTVVITDTFTREGVGDDYKGIRGEIEEKKRLLQEYYDPNGEEPFFLIACHQEKIVGTISYGLCSKLIVDCSNGKLKDTGEIGTVFVLPEYQLRGIGTLLLNSMLTMLMSKAVEEFCLDSGYTRAQRVWRKKFGQPSITIKNYWGEGFDHLIWHCKLRNIAISYKIY